MGYIWAINSWELFSKRLSISKDKSSYDHSAEISEKILWKCGDVPLAIITIDSLLAGKPRADWPEEYNSIGFRHGNSIHVDYTRNILLFRYYDLPYHLRTSLLHLSIFPEDSDIEKNDLIWKWAAEAFIHKDCEKGLFASGESWFNELVSRKYQPSQAPQPLLYVLADGQVSDWSQKTNPAGRLKPISYARADDS